MMTSYICLGHWPFRCLGLSPLSKKCNGVEVFCHISFDLFIYALLPCLCPSTPPGESYLLHYWFVKQLKRLSPKGILVSPCVRNSMLQCCTTPRKGPGRRGDLAVLQSQNPMYILHCRHTTLLYLDLQSKLLFFVELMMKS